MKAFTKWAILQRSENKLDGKHEHFIFEGGTLMDFGTRAAARHYAKVHFKFIKDRKELQAEPHGWKMPKVVKVSIQYKIVKE